MFKENLSIFLRDFGQPVTLPDGREITAIFDNAFYDAAVGNMVMDTTSPRFECRSADIANLKREDLVTIAGVVWSVEEIRPDGTGMSTVMLAYEPNNE